MIVMEYFNLSENQFFWISIGLIGAIVGITLFVWIYRYLKNTAEDRRIEKIIKDESEAYTKDVVLSDGMYGYLFVDYLILMRGKIIALDVQQLGGYIFGGDQIDQWAQVENSKSNKFKNPLYRVRLLSQQVKQLISDVEIEARVLFGSQSSFPKGVPDGVFRFETFKHELNSQAKNDYLHESMSKIWEELLGILKEHKERYSQENQELKLAR